MLVVCCARLFGVVRLCLLSLLRVWWFESCCVSLLCFGVLGLLFCRRLRVGLFYCCVCLRSWFDLVLFVCLLAVCFLGCFCVDLLVF